MELPREQAQPNDWIQTASLRELTRQETAEFLLATRLEHEINTTDWIPQWKYLASTALRISLLVHEGDARDDKSYSTHVLRVATRIISHDHFNVRDDPRAIIIALLHDAVEDRPERLLDEPALDHSDKSPENLAKIRSQQHRALIMIGRCFGADIARGIKLVTNEVHDGSDSQDGRQARYRAKVISLLETNEKAALVKLSDFIDNCLGLEYNPDPIKRLKLAKKYKPLLPAMLDFVMSTPAITNYRDKLIDELFYANELCRQVIEADPRQLGEHVISIILPSPQPELTTL